jgi:hypothetical protein
MEISNLISLAHYRTLRQHGNHNLPVQFWPVNATPMNRLRLAAALLPLALAFTAAAAPETNAVFAARARDAFEQARIRFLANTNDADAGVRFARACFDWADFATNDTARAALAQQGIAVCRQLTAQKPKLAAGHYYLAMNLGQLARTEFLGALKIVKEMEREFKTAESLDPHLDYAGPARGLGLLYRDAPGWPASIGSRRKARSYLEEAVKVAPDFPENLLNLAESDLQWHDSNAAKTELKALDALWPEAQANFTGAEWEQSWGDWSARRAAVRKKAAEQSAPLKSPRNLLTSPPR